MPTSVHAGNVISRVEKLGKAHDAAIRYESALEDGTPESDRAMAVTDRRMSELEALRDEIIAGCNKPFDPRDHKNPYAFNSVEELTVLCALIDALCPWFWTNAKQEGIGPVLLELQKLGNGFKETYLERAERWNASQEAANV